MRMARLSEIDVGLVRAWVILVMGVALIIVGLLLDESQYVMFGFTMIGIEPIIRAKKASDK